jgi:channel protein (hemolysin III family)
MSDIYSIPGFTQPISSLTHLCGAGVFAALSFTLLRRGRGLRSRLAALGVYTFSCVFLLSMSGVYHLLPFGGTPRAVMARLDHAAIFVLIAGTFTPVLCILLDGPDRWVPLVVIWTAAIAGVVVKTAFFRAVPEWLGLVFYLGMGWAGIVPGVRIWRRYGWSYVRPLIWGGVAYSAGALLEFFRWPVLVPGVVGPHELFHLAVLVGITCHWYYIAWLAADGPPPPKVCPGLNS